MAITIKTKRVQNTKIAYRRSLEYKRTFEDRQNDWIKNNLRIKE